MSVFVSLIVSAMLLTVLRALWTTRVSVWLKHRGLKKKFRFQRQHIEIPFSKAAHIGTEKVIRDHSTVGIVLTSDGSFGEITRQQFEPAEEKTVGELRSIGKPFVIVLNCTQPDADDTKKLCHKLSEKYRTAVLPVNCDRLSQKEIDEIMSAILFEFPVSAVNFFMPEWFDLLCQRFSLSFLSVPSIFLCRNGLTFFRLTISFGRECLKAPKALWKMFLSSAILKTTKNFLPTNLSKIIISMK